MTNTGANFCCDWDWFSWWCYGSFQVQVFHHTLRRTWFSLGGQQHWMHWTRATTS